MLSELMNLYLQLSGSVALCERGNCDFTTKAAFAQSGGATGVLMINSDEGSFYCLTHGIASLVLFYSYLFFLFDRKYNITLFN